MNKKLKLVLLTGLPLLGIILGYLLMGRSVQVSVNGETTDIRTHALTVKGALRSAGYTVENGDSISPPENTWLSQIQRIELNQSSLIRIWIEPEGEQLTVDTSAQTPREVLVEAGIHPEDEDSVLINGSSAALDERFERRAGLALQYIPAKQVNLDEDGEIISFHSTAPTLGLALWQQGIRIGGGDWLNVPFDQSLMEIEDVQLVSSKPIEIQVDGIIITSLSAAESVGKAVQDAGITLQDLDFTKPAEGEALPENRKIEVIRVTEKVIMEQSSVAYETEMIADDSLEINQQEVVEPGQNGIKASRVRVRYENGIEVSRTSEADVILVEPVNRVVHFGSQIVNKTISTADGPITYYMSANVIATSYSPCRSGVEGRCFTGTSLGIPVQKGVIGVHRAWYNIFKGTQIYVPGYGIGTIADIGYYPYSDYWIDLGYTDADYEPWYSVSLTIYFLSPPPAGFSGVLP